MVPRAVARAQEQPTKSMIQKFKWTKMKVKIQAEKFSIGPLFVSLSRVLSTYLSFFTGGRGGRGGQTGQMRSDPIRATTISLSFQIFLEISYHTVGLLGVPAVGGHKFSMAQKKVQKSASLGTKFNPWTDDFF